MSDATRTLFLVCYDVCDAAVRRRVQRYLTGFNLFSSVEPPSIGAN